MKLSKGTSTKGAVIAIVLTIAIIGGVSAVYFSGWRPSFEANQAIITTTNPFGQTVTQTVSTTIPTTTTTPVGCPEAPNMLNIPVSIHNDGADYETTLVGDMGVYKGAGVNFNHFGTVISSTAIVFNHFDVTVESYTSDINWALIWIDIWIYGSLNEIDWTEIAHVTQDDIPLAMTDPDTTVFGYDLEINYYDLLGTLGGIVYGDGSTSAMYLDMAIRIDLFRASDGDFLNGGGWLYYGMIITGFKYCVDTSGVYDCNIAWYEFPED